MEERTNIWTTITLMALVGGALTALLYTERGRQSLKRFERALDDFGRSLQDLQGAVQKAGTVAAQGIEVASEGMQVVSGLIGKGERRPGATVTH
jgi:t-SNARE complex subunit (syntaxin)